MAFFKLLTAIKFLNI